MTHRRCLRSKHTTSEADVAVALRRHGSWCGRAVEAGVSEGDCERADRVLAPAGPSGGCVLVCVDDVHLGDAGCQSTLRGLLDSRRWHTRDEETATTPSNDTDGRGGVTACLVLGAHVLATALSGFDGRGASANVAPGLHPRLLRHFTVVCADAPSNDTLTSLYSTVVASHLLRITTAAAVALQLSAETAAAASVSNLTRGSSARLPSAVLLPQDSMRRATRLAEGIVGGVGGAGVAGPSTSGGGSTSGAGAMRTSMPVPTSSTLAAVAAGAKEAADRVVSATMALHLKVKRVTGQAAALATANANANASAAAAGGGEGRDYIQECTGGVQQWSTTHVARIVQGFLAQVTSDVALQPASVVKLWRYQAER